MSLSYRACFSGPGWGWKGKGKCEESSVWGGEKEMERAKRKVREAGVSLLLQEKRRCLEALGTGSLSESWG